MENPIDSTWYVRPTEIKTRTSAGGVILRVEGGRPLVALAREGDHPRYVLPKGGVDKGETLEQAARREILEESGLDDLELVEYLGFRERLNYARTRWMTVHYFLFRSSGRGGLPGDAKHIHPAAWFPPAQLPPMLWPEQEELLRTLAPRLEALAAAG